MTVKLPSALRNRRVRIDAEAAAAAAAAVPPPEAVQPSPQAPEPQPVTAEAPQDQPAPTPPPAPSQADETVRALRDELEATRREIAELRRANTPAPEAAPTPEPEFDAPITVREVSDQERQTYEAASNYIRATAEDIVAQAIRPLVSEINALRKQVKELGGVTQTVAVRTFRDRLKAAIPNFESLVKEPKFKEFAMQESPTGREGVTLMQELHSAYENQDVARIAKIIRMYDAGSAAPAVTPVSPAKPAASAAGNLDAFRQPTPQGGRAVPTVTPDKPKFSKSQRDADYAAFRAGKLSHTDWKAKQAMYTAADIEGRFDHAS